MKKRSVIILAAACILLGLSLFGTSLFLRAEKRNIQTGERSTWSAVGAAGAASGQPGTRSVGGTARTDAASGQPGTRSSGGTARSGAGSGAAPGQAARKASSEKKIALTFDDGPHPFYTEQLLDGLKERGAQVTFFVTGEHAQLHPDLIKRMREDGHLVGNHTYSHIQLRSGNRDVFREELVRTNEILREITGEDIEYVRPPYGSWDKSFEKELNMFPVLWTVDPLDWCSSDAACVAGRVVGHVKENDIILMHDYYESTVTAALDVVDELQREGYRFVTVDEILFD